MFELKLLCLFVVLWNGVAPQTISERMTSLEKQNEALARALQMMQVAMEEYRRDEGDSGITVTRNYRDGTSPLYVGSHSSYSALATHNHAITERTCGMGELGVVLNGVHFRTRHNDYPIVQPASSPAFHATVPIPFPDVPPAVLNAGGVTAQIAEMREWFKAWANGDKSQRDYTKYFKPVLCYLEGAWTNDANETQYKQGITEPFPSVFHYVEAWSWWDLEEKNRFTMWTGNMDIMENIAHLPRAMVGYDANQGPIFTQWNYRILCHPIEGGLELSNLKLVDDLSVRMAADTVKTSGWSGFSKSRAARFAVNEKPVDQVIYDEYVPLLDRIMKQIPGKDNYGAQITDPFMNTDKTNWKPPGTLNAGYYNRMYGLGDEVVAPKQSYRGFNDRNLFVAQTTQPQITQAKIRFCNADQQFTNINECRLEAQRVSYAIPLEIIYLTPLQKWNPYNIQYKGSSKSTLGQTVTANGRVGALNDPTKAFNGANDMNYYFTPASFYDTGKEIEETPEDSLANYVGVLDSTGTLRQVMSSGIRIMLPEIPGVLGPVRTRYPVYPLHEEGLTVWKEMEALRKVVLDQQNGYLHSPPSG